MPDVGYKLRRWLREAMGPEVPPGLARLVAYEIADDANDETRRSRAELGDLAKWTGAKDAKAVRDALLRLGKAGWEFRVPIAKGADGRLVYAARGRALDFEVPKGRHPEGPNQLGPSGSGKGRTQSALPPDRAEPSRVKGRTESTKGPNPVGPLSSGPSSPLISLVDGAAERALRGAGLDDEREIKECIDWIIGAHSPRGPGWWRAVAKNGDLPTLVAQWRAQRAPETPSLPAWCGKCGDENPAARTNPRWRVLDGAPCPTCHPDTIGQSA